MLAFLKGLYLLLSTLLTSNIHCYADDSTGYAHYTGSANMSLQQVVKNREQLVSKIETSLEQVLE